MNIIKNKNNELRSGWSIVICYLLTIVAVSILSMPINTYIAAKNIGRPIEEIMEYMSSGGVMIVLMIIQNMTFIFVSIVLWKKIKKSKISNMGLISLKKGYKDLFMGLAIGAITISIVAGVLLLTENAELVKPLSQPKISMEMLYGIILFIAVGFGEEIFSRGYCMSMLRQTKNKWVVLCLPSIIFGALHLGNDGISILAFINIFLVGIVFSIMYMKSNNIWMPIGFHITWNYFQGNVWGFLVSGSVAEGSMYQVKVLEENLINGGAFGPEGGLVVTGILICIFIYVMYYYRNNSIDNFMKEEEKIK